MILMSTFLLIGCDNANEETAIEHAVKHVDASYICPMHSQIVRDEAGECPICGMNLVKKEIQPPPPPPEKPQDSTHTTSYPTVIIASEIIQKMGVKTIKVKRANMNRHIKTVGYVAYNEEKLVHVHARTSGWVEKLYVRREDDVVKRGQSLLELYSPEVLEAQQNFLVALRSKNKGTRFNREEYREAIQKHLRLLGVSKSTIKKIELKNNAINNFPIYSPQAGTVIHLNIREGMYVTPSLELFSIVDLKTVWVMVEVYEHQLDWVKKGLKADITVPALPGRVWKGKVDYVYPELEPKTRTLKVRLRFKNPKGTLKLNMFAKVLIHGRVKKRVLKIPRQALIMTGERESVIMAMGNGRFMPIDVKTGMRSQGEVEILSGLKKDDTIVLSGQFLIDSEANLQASFLRFQKAPAQHQH